MNVLTVENLNVRFEDIWFNGWHQVGRFLGIKQGEDFSKLLEDPARSLPWNRAVTSKGEKHPAPIALSSDKPPPMFELPGGLRLTLLSPSADQLKRFELQLLARPPALALKLLD